jgi:hypothetical protein
MTQIGRVALVVLALVAMACGSSGGTGSLTELQKVQVGALDVVLLSDDGALGHDRDTFVVEFRSTPDGSLVDVGHVKTSATMPMPGMPPMFGDIALSPTPVAGRYAGTSQLGMAGTWRLAIDWDGPVGTGSATFSPMVQ